MRTDNLIILSDLKKTLKAKFKNNLKDVILFGSKLSGNENTYSDYDILIILKHKFDWTTEREISDLCYEIDLKYEILTDSHVLSEPEFSTPRGKQPIFVNALMNGLYA